jgi:carboxymethylenebutenolidase
MAVTQQQGGFATATQPLTTQTLVRTSSEGLLASDISVPTADGSIPAYCAAPAEGSNHPVVIVVQEIFGVHEHIRDVVRRFARLGYLAIAPDLFVRQGDVALLTSVDDIRRITSRVPDAQVLADLDASLQWATAHGGDKERVAITGFCWGGRITWLYAAHQPQLRAAVAWYGRLQGEPNALQPRFPMDVAGDLKVPVLGLYGGQDAGISVDSVQKFIFTLHEANSASTVHVYGEAPHAFFADYRPSYRKVAAEDGWQRTLQWFRQHGV